MATPLRASSEPKERSKPPVSITNVSPIATIQRTAALVISASRLAEVKKRDCMAACRIRVAPPEPRGRFVTSERSATSVSIASLVVSDRVLGDPRLGGLLARQRRDDPPAVHDKDAVA